MTEQQTLVEFLAARLDEDEAAARAATAGPWHDDGGCISSAGYQITDYGAYTRADGEAEEWEERQQHADSAHIARHDPARVLREVAAKRAIIELADEASGLDQSVDLDRRVGTRDMEEEPFVGDLILRQLAAVYSDHEAYRDEWRP